MVRVAVGNRWQLVESMVDISQLKRVEESRRESEKRFRAAFEQAPIGMCLTGLDGRFLQVNAALSQMLGYSEQELLAGAWQTLIFREDLEVSRQAIDQLVHCGAGSAEIEERYVPKNCDPIWVRLKISTVEDTQGNPSYFIAHVEDIRERKRAEEALRANQESIKRAGISTC